MKKIILLFAIIYTTNNLAQTIPVASFTVNKISGCNPLTVEFTNTSSNAENYLWEFGDGNFSTLEQPSHIYFNSGNYTVLLIAFSQNGQSDTLIINNMISVNERPVADFSVTNNNSCVNGAPVVFINNSLYSTNWLWDFGNGITSSQKNPSHIYAAAGTYTVALIAQNSTGCSDVKVLSQYIVISPKPSAGFYSDTTKFCSLSHSFDFTPDNATASSYNWNFGDGNYSSVQYPSHVYSSGGKYNVTLSVTNQNGCNNSLTKSNYITVSEEINPVFSANNNAGCTPLNVSFNSNLPSTLNYEWNFGNGNISTQSNPSYIYYDTGFYDVSLTVTDANSCSFSYTSDSLVNTNDPLNAAFTANITNGCAPLNVNFTDNSINATSWNWDFGDGNVSTLKNPIHTFFTPGTYTVTLITHNSGGCESLIEKTNFINVFAPVSGFSVNDSSGCTPLAVNFSDTSGNAVQWFWDFGDGTFSTQKNPSHTYANEGFFTVKLITYNNSGCSDTLIKNNIIHSFDPNISFTNTDTVNSCNEITASFNGSSIGANFWTWDFGDGTVSSQPNPSHTFINPGIYSVSLTTQTANGCTITINNYNVYEIYEQNIDFNFSLDTCPNYNATFTNYSPGTTSWLWNFGDGTTSTLQNPSHTYPNAGLYTVALTVTTVQGCTYSVMKNNIIRFADCAGNGNNDGGASFGFGDFSGGSAYGDSTNNIYQITGCAPFNVYFVNPFDSAVSYFWNFGDGDTSDSENPFHNYIAEGIYDVTLIVQLANGESDTLIRNNLIKVNKVIADFSVQQNNTCEAGNIVLSNLSQNANTYFWNFGDGENSALENPMHNYLQAGNYLLKLSASDSFGCNNISVKNIYAGVTVPVFSFSENICINDSMQFSSNMNNYFSYEWDFGDGGFSMEESPFHVFDSAGSFLVSLTVFDSTGCSFTNILPAEIVVNNPIANFNISENSGCGTLLTSFNNTSLNANNWFWNFGDGATSVIQNPAHIYGNTGTYSVSLIAEKNGCANEFILPNAITVYESIADFSFIQNTLCLPITVYFSDSSVNAVSWLWNFSDGTTDTNQHPIHVFTSKPTQNISLTITDINGCSASVAKQNISIFSPAFSASATQGCETLNVDFTDNSNGAISWFWNFGDSTTSSLKNPSHFYSDSGSYTITLIAESQDGCKDTVIYPDYIQVYKVIAGFSSPSELTGCNPLLVNFIDSSVNATKWKWNFGDNSYSTQKNPWHIYTIPGIYDVSLIASNNFGCADTIMKNDFVNVTGPVALFSLAETEGCAPLNIQFFDSSYNNAMNLTWFFGDGDTSHAKNPLHIYDSAGIYTVSLLAEDNSGCSSFYTYPQNITVYPAPQAVFTSYDSAGCQPFDIFFDATLNFSDSAYWNFGDGNFSSLSSQNHSYDSVGTFQPFLVSSNNYGCTDSFYFPRVFVYPTPIADFTADNIKGCSPLTVNFSNESENLNNAVFQWNFGNGSTSNNVTPSATYNDGGLYDISLIVTNEFNCADTMTKNNFIMTYDLNPPTPSDVVVVTVSSNTSAFIVWKESNAVDFEKYVLYRKNNLTGQYSEIAVLNDIDITSYSDENLNTLNNSYCYKLQTVDFCGNSIDMKELTEYCTMNVTAKTNSAKISVQWTPYVGCNISKYEILRIKPGQNNYEMISSVDANTLNYEDSSWHCFTEYSYKIKAVGVCGNPVASFSDTSRAKADENVFSNQKVEIIRSTVINNSAVFTEWKSPELAPEKVSGYKIYRSPGNMKFELIATLPSVAHSYIDDNTDVSKQNYYYKVETVNICEVKAQLSGNASSVLLNAEENNYEVKLKWTPYKNWENGVEQYIIERQDENGNWNIVKIVDGGINEIKDSLLK